MTKMALFAQTQGRIWVPKLLTLWLLKYGGQDFKELGIKWKDISQQIWYTQEGKTKQVFGWIIQQVAHIHSPKGLLKLYEYSVTT